VDPTALSCPSDLLMASARQVGNGAYHFLYSFMADQVTGMNGFKRLFKEDDLKIGVSNRISSGIGHEETFNKEENLLFSHDKIIALAEIYLILPQTQRDAMFTKNQEYWRSEVESFLTSIQLNIPADQIFSDEFYASITPERIEAMFEDIIRHFSSCERVFRYSIIKGKQYEGAYDDAIRAKMQEKGPLVEKPNGHIDAVRGVNWFEAYDMSIDHPSMDALKWLPLSEQILLSLVSGGTLERKVEILVTEFMKRNMDRAATLFADRVLGEQLEYYQNFLKRGL
jgi:hypothetical protein